MQISRISERLAKNFIKLENFKAAGIYQIISSEPFLDRILAAVEHF